MRCGQNREDAGRRSRIRAPASFALRVMTSPDQIRQGLLGTHDYHGAEGVYNFDEHGDGLHGYNVVQVKDGKIVEIKYVDLSNPS
ncbi:hypothetical protein SAMN05421543_108104 [Alicyclobacillus macrosporangiidus]|uniref:Branched-chain amino acid transport system substrate-binding protein n=1 Tax=Alicyclobacillus macrosporangiidus TaxID=392015 RepID=A0A1I7J3L5_9BACL|nr:hypothetical protein SAMN05421543_108104 [Alicyclobacillus macrosporangiidus]